MVPDGTSRNQGNGYYPFVAILLLVQAIAGDIMLNVHRSGSQPAEISLSQRKAVRRSSYIYSAGAGAKPRICLWHRPRNLPEDYRPVTIRISHWQPRSARASQIIDGRWAFPRRVLLFHSAYRRAFRWSRGQDRCSISRGIGVPGKFNSGPSRRR
jgi:hypothetical protein